MADTGDLYTTVKNTSGREKIFSYLGDHGRKLAANATCTVVGNVIDYFGRGPERAIKLRSYEADLKAGRLSVLSTPKQVIADVNPDAMVANPTVAATVAPTGGGATGGSMAAGKYKVAYTWVNTWGESTVGTSASAQFTVGATNIPRVTLPALPTNAASISLYVTAVDPTTADITTLRRYATGITTTTSDMTAAVSAVDGTHPAPPTVNSTAAAAAFTQRYSDAVLGAVDPSWKRYPPPT
jgi:hypothetical protein